tara:strand:- start:1185 stop:1547 length:363 start_codon:yes stop_codon:yes gene_type:complete
MYGTQITTGKILEEREHIKQSIQQILTTPIGSVVGNRAYGCRVWDILDSPINAMMRLEFYSAVMDALSRWENRFKVVSVKLKPIPQADEGLQQLELSKLYIDIHGHYQGEMHPSTLVVAL